MKATHPEPRCQSRPPIKTHFSLKMPLLFPSQQGANKQNLPLMTIRNSAVNERTMITWDLAQATNNNGSHPKKVTRNIWLIVHHHSCSLRGVQRQVTGISATRMGNKCTHCAPAIASQLDENFIAAVFLKTYQIFKTWDGIK